MPDAPSDSLTVPLRAEIDGHKETRWNYSRNEEPRSSYTGQDLVLKNSYTLLASHPSNFEDSGGRKAEKSRIGGNSSQDV